MADAEGADLLSVATQAWRGEAGGSCVRDGMTTARSPFRSAGLSGWRSEQNHAIARCSYRLLSLAAVERPLPEERRRMSPGHERVPAEAGMLNAIQIDTADD